MEDLGTLSKQEPRIELLQNMDRATEHYRFLQVHLESILDNAVDDAQLDEYGLNQALIEQLRMEKVEANDEKEHMLAALRKLVRKAIPETKDLPKDKLTFDVIEKMLDD